MASITDCVVEGLKYPFADIKKLLGIGVFFAIVSAMSVFMSVRSFDVFRASAHIAENTNTTVSHLAFSQLPTGDIYLVVGLAIVSFIISLFIMGYQYDTVKFSIAKKQDLPGFGDVLAMFVKGIKYFAVSLAYVIIPILVGVCAVVFGGNSSVLIVIGLVSMVLGIIAYLLLIMALNNMVAHDSIKKAFDFTEILANISNLGWGKYIGTVIFTNIVYMVIMVAVSFVLSFITVLFAATISNQAFIISIVLAVIQGLFIDSYGALFFSRVCGSIYRESIK